MLITTKHNLKPVVGNTLVSVEDKGDRTYFFHAQRVDGILEQNKEDRREGIFDKPQGEAKWRHIGRIPELLLVQHPEWVHDPSLIVKFLQSTEGEPYRTVDRI